MSAASEMVRALGWTNIENLLARGPREGDLAYSEVEITPTLAKEAGLRFPPEAETDGLLFVRTIWRVSKQKAVKDILIWELSQRDRRILGEIIL